MAPSVPAQPLPHLTQSQKPPLLPHPAHPPHPPPVYPPCCSQSKMHHHCKSGTLTKWNYSVALQVKGLSPKPLSWCPVVFFFLWPQPATRTFSHFFSRSPITRPCPYTCPIQKCYGHRHTLTEVRLHTCPWVDLPLTPPQSLLKHHFLWGSLPTPPQEQ